MILKNRIIAAIIILIALLGATLLLTTGQKATETYQIPYGNFQLTKTVELANGIRTETITVPQGMEADIIMVVPKEIAQSAGELEFSYDGQMQILKDDPVIKFTRSEEKGKKEIKVKTKRAQSPKGESSGLFSTPDIRAEPQTMVVAVPAQMNEAVKSEIADIVAETQDALGTSSNAGNFQAIAQKQIEAEKVFAQELSANPQVAQYYANKITNAQGQNEPAQSAAIRAMEIALSAKLSAEKGQEIIANNAAQDFAGDDLPAMISASLGQGEISTDGSTVLWLQLPEPEKKGAKAFRPIVGLFSKKYIKPSDLFVAIMSIEEMNAYLDGRPFEAKKKVFAKEKVPVGGNAALEISAKDLGLREGQYYIVMPRKDKPAALNRFAFEGRSAQGIPLSVTSQKGGRPEVEAVKVLVQSEDLMYGDPYKNVMGEDGKPAEGFAGRPVIYADQNIEINITPEKELDGIIVTAILEEEKEPEKRPEGEEQPDAQKQPAEGEKTDARIMEEGRRELGNILKKTGEIIGKVQVFTNLDKLMPYLAYGENKVKLKVQSTKRPLKLEFRQDAGEEKEQDEITITVIKPEPWPEDIEVGVTDVNPSATEIIPLPEDFIRAKIREQNPALSTGALPTPTVELYFKGTQLPVPATSPYYIPLTIAEKDKKREIEIRIADAKKMFANVQAPAKTEYDIRFFYGIGTGEYQITSLTVSYNEPGIIASQPGFGEAAGKISKMTGWEYMIADTSDAQDAGENIRKQIVAKISGKDIKYLLFVEDSKKGLPLGAPTREGLVDADRDIFLSAGTISAPTNKEAVGIMKNDLAGLPAIIVSFTDMESAIYADSPAFQEEIGIGTYIEVQEGIWARVPMREKMVSDEAKRKELDNEFASSGQYDETTPGRKTPIAIITENGMLTLYFNDPQQGWKTDPLPQFKEAVTVTDTRARERLDEIFEQRLKEAGKDDGKLLALAYFNPADTSGKPMRQLLITEVETLASAQIQNKAGENRLKRLGKIESFAFSHTSPKLAIPADGKEPELGADSALVVANATVENFTRLAAKAGIIEIDAKVCPPGFKEILTGGMKGKVKAVVFDGAGCLGGEKPDMENFPAFFECTKGCGSALLSYLNIRPGHSIGEAARGVMIANASAGLPVSEFALYGNPALVIPNLKAPSSEYTGTGLEVKKVRATDLLNFSAANEGPAACIAEMNKRNEAALDKWVIIGLKGEDKSAVTNTQGFRINDSTPTKFSAGSPKEADEFGLFKIVGDGQELESPLIKQGNAYLATLPLQLFSESANKSDTAQLEFEIDAQKNTVTMVSPSTELEKIENILAQKCFYPSQATLIKLSKDGSYIYNGSRIIAAGGENMLDFSKAKKAVFEISGKKMETAVSAGNAKKLGIALSPSVKNFLYENGAIESGYTVTLQS